MRDIEVRQQNVMQRMDNMLTLIMSTTCCEVHKLHILFYNKVEHIGLQHTLRRACVHAPSVALHSHPAVSVTFDCCRRLGRRFHRCQTYIFCCISAVNTHKYCPAMCSCSFILFKVVALQQW